MNIHSTRSILRESIDSDHQCSDLTHSVVVDLLLVGLVALALVVFSFLSVALLATFFLFGLLLLFDRLVEALLGLLGGCLAWLWQVLDFFDLVDWGEALKVVCDNLLLLLEQLSLHLKCLRVRLLVLLLDRLVSFCVRAQRENWGLAWLSLGGQNLDAASRWHQSHVWWTEHQNLLGHSWHWVGESSQLVLSMGEAAACSVFARALHDEYFAERCLVVTMDGADLSHSWERFGHGL